MSYKIAYVTLEQIVCTRERNIYRLSALTFCLTLAIMMQWNFEIFHVPLRLPVHIPCSASCSACSLTKAAFLFGVLCQRKRRESSGRAGLRRRRIKEGGGGLTARSNDIYIPLSRIFYFFLFWVPFLNRSSRKYPPRYTLFFVPPVPLARTRLLQRFTNCFSVPYKCTVVPLVRTFLLNSESKITGCLHLHPIL